MKLKYMLLAILFIISSFFIGRYSKQLPRKSKINNIVDLIIQDGGGTIQFAPGVYKLENDSSWRIDTIKISAYTINESEKRLKELEYKPDTIK